MNHLLADKDKQALLDLLVEQLGVQRSALTTDAKIQEDLGADSLTVMEITMAVEERFNLSIPDEQWEQVSTVGDLCETLGKRLNDPAQQTA